MPVVRSLLSRQTESRYSLEDYASDLAAFYYSGTAYATNQTYDSQPAERAEHNFASYVQGAYKANGVIFACMLARMLLFAEARFKWRRLGVSRPGDLFGNTDLVPLEQPWTNGTTGSLLSRMIQDTDLAGNAFVRRTRPTVGQLERLRPDWVTIVMGSQSDFLNSQVLAYVYKPGGDSSNEDPIALAPTEVAHWAPIPDPIATYRGQSWISPVVREIQSDKAANDHKLAFFEHAATPNMVIKLDPSVTPTKLDEFRRVMEMDHGGRFNAYKTLYLGGGADATVVGANFEQMDFKNVQGAGETRIAAAAGVPPVIVGLSEGLAAATYSNYGQARRRFADGTIRPLWRSACASLSPLLAVPASSELWYDDRDIAFLQEDQKDAAEVQSTQAQTIAALVREGFTPESVVKSVMASDFTLLEHTGKLSVQLQDPNAPTAEPATDDAVLALNGSGGSSNGNAA